MTIQQKQQQHPSAINYENENKLASNSPGTTTTTTTPSATLTTINHQVKSNQLVYKKIFMPLYQQQQLDQQQQLNKMPISNINMMTNASNTNGVTSTISKIPILTNNVSNNNFANKKPTQYEAITTNKLSSNNMNNAQPIPSIEQKYQPSTSPTNLKIQSLLNKQQQQQPQQQYQQQIIRTPPSLINTDMKQYLLQRSASNKNLNYHPGNLLQSPRPAVSLNNGTHQSLRRTPTKQMTINKVTSKTSKQILHQPIKNVSPHRLDDNYMHHATVHANSSPATNVYIDLSAKQHVAHKTKSDTNLKTPTGLTETVEKKILLRKKSKKSGETTATIRRSKSISVDYQDEELLVNDDKEDDEDDGIANENDEDYSDMTSSPSPFSSCSITSAKFSSIVNNIEETNNLFDFASLIRKQLKRVEHEYSLESLFAYLRDNVKYNGYRNFTLEFLEAYLRTSKLTSTYYNAGASSPSSQVQMKSNLAKTKSKVKRSLTQVNQTNSNSQQQKPTKASSYFSTISSKYDLNGRQITTQNTKAIEKLFTHLSFLRLLFELMQRELIFNILTLDLRTTSQSPTIPESRSFKNANQLKSQNNNTQQILSNKTSSKSVNNLTYRSGNNQHKIDPTTLLNKLQFKLFDLNDSLDILLNDTTNCDVKLLSQKSNLPIKYDYYKHGEFVLRLTSDICYKMNLTLTLCERFFNLNFKLSGQQCLTNYYSNQKLNMLSLHKKEANLINTMSKLSQHINNMGTSSRNNDYDENDLLDLEYDNVINDHTNFSPSLANESNAKNSSILKKIIRKKSYQFTNPNENKLPKISSHQPTKTQQMNLTNVIDEKKEEKEETRQSKETPTKQKDEAAIKQTNLLLTKQDTNDSFIQDTDCSSIISSDSTAYFSETNTAKTKQDQKPLQPHLPGPGIEKKRLPSVDRNVSPLKLIQQSNREKIIEEYKQTKLQLESTNQTINDLDIYLQGLFNRIERCARLEEQLSSDQELIRKTKNSLKVYNSNIENNRKTLKTNLGEEKDEMFKIQLQKQLGYLQYRFGLNLQDLNTEKMHAAQIEQAIHDTQLKLSNLNYKKIELNKYLIYLESQQLVNTTPSQPLQSQLMNNQKMNYLRSTNNTSLSNASKYYYQKDSNKSNSKLSSYSPLLQQNQSNQNSHQQHQALPKCLPPIQTPSSQLMLNHPIISMPMNYNTNDYYYK